MELSQMRLFYHPAERLRMTVEDDRSYLSVKPVWVAPQSHPERFLALLDGKGKEIVILEDPSTLSPDNRRAVERELRHRYLTATVDAILNARQEYGATYWTVQTDRGERDFVTQNLQENALWFSDTHLMLLDVDGNRFEILDVAAMDSLSQATLGRIL